MSAFDAAYRATVPWACLPDSQQRADGAVVYSYWTSAHVHEAELPARENVEAGAERVPR